MTDERTATGNLVTTGAGALMLGVLFLVVQASGGPSSMNSVSPAADECCSPPAASGTTPAPKPAAPAHALPIDTSREIVFSVENLGCPLVNGVGCGHLLAPALAELDGIPGVMRSYTNWTGAQLRITVAPNSDLAAVAERVRASLAAGQQQPARLEGDALQKSLNEQDWRAVEHVVDLTSYEFHTFARQQVGAFADEQKLDPDKRVKLLKLVDAVWDKAAQGLGNPGPASEAYSDYWRVRLDKLKQMFAQDANDLLSPEQLELLMSRYSGRRK